MKISNKILSISIIFTFIGLVIECPCLFAQQNSDSSKVEAANQSFYKAFSDESIKEMDQIWSHSSFASAIHPGSINIITGWKGVKESFESVFKTYEHVNITPKDPYVHVNGNIAWVLCHEEFQAQQGEKTVKLTAAAINIFLKESGKWLMIHHQATVPAKE